MWTVMALPAVVPDEAAAVVVVPLDVLDDEQARPVPASAAAERTKAVRRIDVDKGYLPGVTSASMPTSDKVT